MGFGAVDALTNEPSENSKLRCAVLMFHGAVVVIHAFIFAFLKHTYSAMKTGTPIYSTSSLFHTKYYDTINRNRCNLNGGYEIPKANEAKRQSLYYDTKYSDGQNYEVPSLNKRTVYAEIHNGTKPSGGYESTSFKPAEYNTLDTLR